MHHCLPAYTGAFCNHFVYTAGTSGSVKGQYAANRGAISRKRKTLNSNIGAEVPKIVFNLVLETRANTLIPVRRAICPTLARKSVS